LTPIREEIETRERRFYLIATPSGNGRCFSIPAFIGTKLNGSNGSI
jgi:hypothetical protein